MITTLIRNRNEEEFIGFALQSIIDHIGLDVEVIILDNNSTDESLNIVNMFNNRFVAAPKIIHISSDEYSPGRALNIGFALASNDITLVLSAHCQIAKFNLGYVNESLRYKYSCVFGNQIPVYRGKKINKRYVWSNFTDDVEQVENMYSTLENRHFLHNAFAVYNTDVVREYPFREDLPSKEDRYWAEEVRKHGIDYLYLPDLMCHHFFTENGATWRGLG